MIAVEHRRIPNDLGENLVVLTVFFYKDTGHGCSSEAQFHTVKAYLGVESKWQGSNAPLSIPSTASRFNKLDQRPEALK